MSAPDLSVVIPSWNTRTLTLACLRALYAEEPRHSREVIVVDNGSTDDSVAAVAAAYPGTTVIRNEDNRLYAAANNQGARAARGEFLCTLNSDTEVRPGTLDALVDFLLENPEYGAVAPRLANPDGSVQHACMSFPTLMSALCFDSFWGSFPPGSWVQDRYLMKSFDHLHSRDVAQPPGTCLLMRRQEFLDLGGLDEELALFFNDVDLCRRLWRRGRRIRYLAEAEVMHHRGASTSSHDRFLVLWHKNRLGYYRKHYGPWVMPWMWLVIRLRVCEEWIKIGRRQKDKWSRAAERRYLRDALRELRAS